VSSSADAQVAGRVPRHRDSETSGRSDLGRQGAARRERRTGWAFVLPTLIVLLVLNIFPLVFSLILSFTRIDTSTGLTIGEVTLDNWRALASDGQFWSSVWFTLIFTIAASVVEYVVGFSLALILRDKIAGGGFFRVLFAIPMMLAPVAIGFTWRMLYDQSNGPINSLLRGLHLGSPPWLSDSHLAIAAVVIMDVWEWTPLVFLLLLAGLQSIPSEVVEAARVDGATSWQVVTRILFPMLLPVTVTAMFLRMIDSFQVFGQIFLLTGGGPGTATTSTTLFGFFQGFQNFDLGYGATIALALLLIVILFSTVFLRVSRRLLQRVEG
jgi:multiple sugar transport system permease protein